MYALCLPSQTASEWHSQVFEMSTFPLNIPLLPSPHQPSPKTANTTLCIQAATTGLQHHCFPPLPRVWVTKGTLLSEFSRGPESKPLILIHAVTPHVPHFLKDLLVADQAEETGLLTLVNHMKAQSKQA